MRVFRLIMVVTFFVTTATARAQDLRQFTDEELRESLDLWHIEIPIHAYLEIVRAFEGRWLDYRMRTNPLIPREVWYDAHNNVPRDYYSVVLGDTIDPHLFELLYSVRKFPDSSYAGSPSSALGFHYYLVEKKENVFVSRVFGQAGTSSRDTIKVNAYAELYPYDNYFVFYYDKDRGEPHVRAIGGNIAWEAMPYRYNLPFGYITARLVQYKVHPPISYGGFIQEVKGLRNDTLAMSKNKEYWVAQKSLLSKNPILISTPPYSNSRKKSYDDEIGILYYSRCPAITGDSTCKTICEVKYTIKPHVVDIRERHPTIRILSDEERLDLYKTNLRWFVDWCIDECQKLNFQDDEEDDE